VSQARTLFVLKFYIAWGLYYVKEPFFLPLLLLKILICTSLNHPKFLYISKFDTLYLFKLNLVLILEVVRIDNDAIEMARLCDKIFFFLYVIYIFSILLN
jgi:hypothetical protein